MENTLDSPGMKRLSLLAVLTAFTLSVTACGTPTTVRYRATWNDASKASVYVESVERVIIRKLAAIEIPNPGIAVIPENQESAIVTITTPDAQVHDAVKHVLSQPFSFDLRLENGQTVEGDLSTIDWATTGIDGSMLTWVQAIGNKETSEVSLDLQFNDEGKAKLETLAGAQQGKRLGIFVRDVLVSMLTIQSGFSAEHVIIGGIPSATVAEIFADDVNVGLHVSFTPL